MLLLTSLTTDTYTVGGVDTLDGIAAHPWRDELTLRLAAHIHNSAFSVLKL